MKKPVLFAVVALAALAAGAVFHWSRVTPAQDTDDALPAQAETNATGVATVPSARVPDRPLPAVDAPLRDTIADLKRRADQGEAGAACRLAAEWTYCRGLQMRVRASELLLSRAEQGVLRLSDQPESGRRSGSIERLAARVDEAQRRLDDSKAQQLHCEGVPVPRSDEVSRYWRNAAHAGHLPAMRNYAVGNAFRRDQVLDNLSALAIYKQEAVGIAEAAVARGDLATAMALAAAYSPLNPREDSYLSQVVDDDPDKALALLYRIRDAVASVESDESQRSLGRELSGMVEDLEATMPPTAIQQARANAANAPRLSATGLGTRRRFSVAAGYVGDVQREECDLTAPAKLP